jgi:eukaryotic-like serine/threonine-protein kinase
MWQVNQTIKDDRFLIQSILGGGGFGVAYLAEDRKECRQVVIKTLNQHQQNQADFAEQQEKFMNEAMKLKGFAHPNIVKVYEVILVVSAVEDFLAFCPLALLLFFPFSLLRR